MTAPMVIRELKLKKSKGQVMCLIHRLISSS